MNNLEMKIDALCMMLVSESEAERTAARKSLCEMIKAPAPMNSEAYNPKVSDILLEIGVPDHLLGYRYLHCAIEITTEDRSAVDEICALYFKVAKEFGSTASRVERAMRHAIEYLWLNGDIEVLKEYFGNTISCKKGKPTNGQFISRIANVLRQKGGLKNGI